MYINSISHPILLLKRNIKISFYREQINFFHDLLSFLIINKKFFYINKKEFIDIILSKFLIRMHREEIRTKQYTFFQSIITHIKKFNHKKYNIYSYLLSLIGIIFFLGYHPTAILALAEKENSIDEIYSLIKNIINKYSLNIKVLIIAQNQTLKKGLTLQYKNFIIDSSLVKLEKLIKQELSISE